jgi:hypothetical protein
VSGLCNFFIEKIALNVSANGLNGKAKLLAPPSLCMICFFVCFVDGALMRHSRQAS